MPSSKAGFSLIEILVILVIISILATITVNGLGKIGKETDQHQFNKIIKFLNSNIIHSLISGETITLEFVENKITAKNNNTEINKIELNHFFFEDYKLNNKEHVPKFDIYINQSNLLKNENIKIIHHSILYNLNLSINGVKIEENK